MLIELDTRAGWSLTSWLYDGAGAPSLLDARTTPPPEDLAGQHAAFVAAIDACLAHPTLTRLLGAGVELRFELALPPDFLGLAVDQLMIGVGAEEDGTRLGASFPVVVRPLSWVRPTRTAAAAQRERRFRSKRRRLYNGATRVLEMGCPMGWRADELEQINESDDIVGILLTCGPESTANPAALRHCLRANVLQIVFLRGATAGPGAWGEISQVTAPLPDAPRQVRAWRVRREVNHDRLSLIWHVEPIELPDLPFEQPLIK